MSSISPYFIISLKIYSQKFQHFVMAASASARLTLLPSIKAVSIALFSYICFKHTVQLMGGLLWILQQLSPYRQAPILQKKGQFTLSIQVPQTLANRSAIMQFYNRVKCPNLIQVLIIIGYKEVDNCFMLFQGLFIALLAIESCSFTVETKSKKNSLFAHQTNSNNFGQELKYFGKGFGTDLQSTFLESIVDSTVYYSGQFFNQSNFILKKLKTKKNGDWHVFVIEKVNISKITQFSTGFAYYSENDTWAFFYNVSPYAKNFLYMAIYQGNQGKTPDNVSSLKEDIGRGVDATTVPVIKSIVGNLNTLPDILKYIEKYDSQKWSGISIPVKYNDINPNFYAALSASNVFIVFTNVTLNKVESKLVLYV